MALWLKRTIAAKRCKSSKSCSLDTAWIEKWAKVTVCPILGMPFAAPGAKQGSTTDPRAPSLDRIDSSKGYTPENTRVVSYFVNVAKNAWPEEQFKLLVMAAANNMRN